MGKPESALTIAEVGERNWGWPKRRPRPGHYIRQQKWLDPPAEEQDEEEFGAAHGRPLCSSVRFSSEVEIREFSADTPPTPEDDITQVGFLYVIDEESQEWEDSVEADEEVVAANDLEDEGEEGEVEGVEAAEAESEAEAEAETEASAESEADAEAELGLEAQREAEAEVAKKDRGALELRAQPEAGRAPEAELPTFEKAEDELPAATDAEAWMALVLRSEDADSGTSADAEEPEPEADSGAGEAELLGDAAEDSGADDLKLRCTAHVAADTTDEDVGDETDEHEHGLEQDRQLQQEEDTEKREQSGNHHEYAPSGTCPITAAALASLEPDAGCLDCDAAALLIKQDDEALPPRRKATLAEFRLSMALQPSDDSLALRPELSGTREKIRPLSSLSGARKEELEQKCNMTEDRIEEFARFVRSGMNGRLARSILYHAGKCVGHQMESVKSLPAHPSDRLHRFEPILDSLRAKMEALQCKLSTELGGAQSLGPRLVLRIAEAAFSFIFNERDDRRRLRGAGGGGAGTLASSGYCGAEALQPCPGSISTLGCHGAGSRGAATTVTTGWHQSRWLACIVRAGVQASGRAMTEDCVPASSAAGHEPRSLDGHKLAEQARLMAEWIEHWPTHVFPKNPRPRHRSKPICP